MIENQIEVGKIYRNIKNGKPYRVEGIGKYTEEPMALETMVFYKALYKDNQPYWVRPYWLFKEKFNEETVTERIQRVKENNNVYRELDEQIAKERNGRGTDW